MPSQCTHELLSPLVCFTKSGITSINRIIPSNVHAGEQLGLLYTKSSIMTFYDGVVPTPHPGSRRRSSFACKDYYGAVAAEGGGGVILPDGKYVNTTAQHWASCS